MTNLVTRYANEKIGRIEKRTEYLKKHYPQKNAETMDWFVASIQSITRIATYHAGGLTTTDEAMKAIANVEMI